MERKPAARNFGSEQQERSKAQRSAAEDRRLLGRLHGRERHRNSWFEALAARTEPHCGAQVEEGNHARNRPPPPYVPRSVGAERQSDQLALLRLYWPARL